MSDRSRVMVLFLWTAGVLFASLLFLGGGFFQSILISLFVLVSCVLGLGRRRLLQASFAVTLVAIAVSLGFPHPSEWGKIAHSAWKETHASEAAGQ